MKFRSIFILILFLLPTFMFAGEIYGTLKKDGKPLVKQEINILQNGKIIGTDTTDANGYFSITIKQVGQCKLEVTGLYGASYDVFSTNSSIGYTLMLVKEGDKWQLKKQ